MISFNPNLLGGLQSQPQSMLPNNWSNVYTARSGEPVLVSGIESVKTFPTVPNSKTVLFKKDENLFYVIETDANNYPVIKACRYNEIDLNVNSENEVKYVTLEEFERFKEELINGKQHIRAGADGVNDHPSNGEQHQTDAAINEQIGSQSKSSANVAKSSKSKSSV